MSRFYNAIIIDGQVHELVSISDYKSLSDDNEVCNYCSLQSWCSNHDIVLCGLFGAKVDELFRITGQIHNRISILTI